MEDWRTPERTPTSTEETTEKIKVVLDTATKKLEEVEFIRGSLPPLLRITEILLPIAELSRNQVYIGVSLPEKIKNTIEKNPAYQIIKLVIALYADVYTLQRKFSEQNDNPYLEKLRRTALLFNDLAKQIYGSKASRPDRSYESMFTPYQDERGFEEYRELLFPDINAEEFESYLRNSPPGQWLDIGSGNTYKNPDSLMCRLQSINPGITILGIDPVYDAKNARPIDILYGAAGIDTKNPLSRNLIAGVGQRLPYENNTFEKVLIAHVLSWMKHRHQIGQILRQAARVLVPGGELRFTALPGATIDEPENPLNIYFEIVSKKSLEDTAVTDKREEVKTIVFDVIARKKILSGSLKLRLQREIEQWETANLNA